MRILHVISGIQRELGGPTVALVGLVKAQLAAGLQVSVVSTWKDPQSHETAATLTGYGANVELIGPARGALSRHPALVQTVDRLVTSADVVHVHAMWEEIQHQGCRLARKAGVPYVMTPHGMLDPWNMQTGRLKKRIYLALRMRRNLDHAAAVHFTTQIERDWVRRMRLASPEIVEPLGLDLSEFRQLPPGGILKKHPKVGERTIVLFLGRINRGKGLELLLPAFAKAKTGREVVVVVGPDFGFQTEAEQMVSSLGLNNDVLFTGALYGPDRISAIVDCDILAMPSYHENFGIAVAEAMAAGRPVITSDQVNLHPDITQAQAGEVVPLDIEQLAAVLRRWLADPRLRTTAGKLARDFALARYDWDRIAGHWAGYYQEILGRRL